MFSKSKSNKAPTALAVYYPPAVYTPGSVMEGEVELNFRQIQEDNIDEVHVKLRGISYTYAGPHPRFARAIHMYSVH